MIFGCAQCNSAVTWLAPAIMAVRLLLQVDSRRGSAPGGVTVQLTHILLRHIETRYSVT